MPVRDVEWWAPARTTTTFANRGANGIDGVVSTAFGVAAAGSTIALVGDLTFLHDLSALVDGVDDGATAVVVVVDNAGGGIFSFLTQGRVLDEATFERFFATPRRHDLVGVARALGHEATRVSSGPDLASAIALGLGRAGVSVVVAEVRDRSRNVALHDELVAGAATHWESR
jgi:2-succinyl-5-enolpyruvyl-6-hydroxy-3-cyclohexene-1-carboxylate synthase